jgi:FkbM family methyltransferase
MVGSWCIPPLPARLYSALMRRIPISSGLTRLSFNRLTNHLFARCSDPIEAVMLNGARIDVDPNDYHGRVLYLFGTNDPKVQAVAHALLRRGDRFFDIGANYSSIGIQMASVVGPEGQVHLFEPQPTLCRRVRTTIDQSSLTNVHVHGVGLMDRDGEMVLAMPPYHSGMATLIPDNGQDGWQKQSIPVRDVATYLPPLIDGCSFGVKIDVEGAEIYLMPWLLRQPALRFLIFESAHNQRQLWDMIKASGFALYGLRRIVIAKQVERVDVYEQMSQYHDLVAVRLRATHSIPQVTTPYLLGLELA